MLDLSAVAPRKMEPWFDQRLSKLQGMSEGTINTHLHSMLHSQKHDYKADLRLILDAEEGYDGKGDPFDPTSYTLKGMQTALKVCKQVVIKHDGREFVWKNADGPTGYKDAVGNIIADDPGRRAPSAANAVRKPLDL